MPSPLPDRASDAVLDTTPPVFQLALAALEPELARIPPEALLCVNLDVPAIVLVAIGTAGRVAAHRGEMIEWFGPEMLESALRLELVARAAGLAHVRWKGSVAPVDVERLSALVVAARAQLVTDFQGLVHRGLLPGELLDTLRGIKGYRNQCFDLLQLVSILRREWPRIEPATILEVTDLDRAEALANRLVVALASRGKASGAAAAADLRQRAFTQLCSTYDDVRRMVSFLRWKHGDLEDIAPSFYAGRRGKKRRSQPDAATDGDAEITEPNDVAPGLPGHAPFSPEP